MPNAVTITLYGGSPGEIGGNRILLEWPGHRWLLDFGTRFAQNGKYFAEFLNPRVVLGLRDYLRMGLVPPLDGLYRADLCAHDPQIFGRYREHPMYRQIDHVDGVLLSHGHIDHIGSIGFLREDIPVYTGLMTALIGKCLQDPQPTGLDREFNYSVPRECEEGGDVLKTVRGAPRIQRRYYIAETDPAIATAMEKLKEFWEWVPGDRSSIAAKPLEVRDPAKMGLRFWRVDHSIPGSGAWGLETPIGWVIYSGDLRTHGHSAFRTEKFAKEAAALKPALLIVEGTRVGPDEASVTEPVVHEAADRCVQTADGLVIADFTARNIERLRTFRDIAKARSRRLVITTKDAYSLERMHTIDPNIPTPGEDGIAILKEPAGTTPSWERDVCDKHSGCFVAAREIARDPGSYILALSYWDISNLIDIEPRGGTYIYSSSEAYNEEQEIDAQRLCNWLDHFGLKRVGGLPGAEKGPYHASGHADGPALEKVIEEIGAKQIMPVHTEHPEWFEQRWSDRLVMATEGRSVSVS